MVNLVYLSVFISLVSFTATTVAAQQSEAIKFLRYYDSLAAFFKQVTEDEWKHSTNITKYNSLVKNKADLRHTKKMNEVRKRAAKIDLKAVDKDIRRQIEMLLETTTSSDESVTRNLIEVGTQMANIYSTGTIKNDPNIIKSIKVKKGIKELRLNEHLQQILTKSNDPEELKYVWKAWRDCVGPKAKDLYTEYVHLNNLGAQEHGYKDKGQYRRSKYEVDDLEKIAEDFLEDMRPFYLEIHAYVRFKLSHVYPDIVDKDGLIPAHLLGDMWSQNWGNIYRHLIPFPDEPNIDISSVIEKELSVKKMFEVAENFFVSLGWQNLPRKFWTHSLFVEPKNRKVDCHASAWDFYDEDNGEPDVRVKMCTLQTQDDFYTVHHELGHNYYQMLYWNQPMVYRDGANPGFHEAVGDIMELSVQTPTHLKKIGLLKETSSTNEADINFLLKTALGKVVFLPFAFVMDKWMWHVYNGDIKPDEYNSKWWEYRVKYQGIKPPVERDDDVDFDPGAKMHIVNDVSYIRYFFAHILQFVFHDRACELANHKGPLHLCSIFNSKEAGKGLKDMLALGRSKPWPEALKQYTGSPDISTKSIKEYFNPLIKWLEKYRKEKEYKIGWDSKM